MRMTQSTSSHPEDTTSIGSSGQVDMVRVSYLMLPQLTLRLTCSAWMAPPHINIGPKRFWLEPLTCVRLLSWFSPCIWGETNGIGYRARQLLHQTRLGRWIVDKFWAKLSSDTLEQSGVLSDPILKPLVPEARRVRSTLEVVNTLTDIVLSGSRPPSPSSTIPQTFMTSSSQVRSSSTVKRWLVCPKTTSISQMAHVWLHMAVLWPARTGLGSPTSHFSRPQCTQISVSRLRPTTLINSITGARWSLAQT